MNLNLPIRHAGMALAVVVLAALAAAGCVGPAVGGERIHSFTVDAVIRSDDTVDIREVIDWDYGPNDKRGIFRDIPTDGGAPVDITVSSPTAPDQFTVSPKGTATEIRIGDPDVTISGRHRYEITYTLPATIVEDRFALDAIGNGWPVPIEDARATILGAELDEPRCFSGPAGSTDRCDITEVDGGYRTEIDRLGSREGFTIDGDVVDTAEASFGDVPPFEDRDAGARFRWAGIVAAIGAVVALAAFVLARQIGRNQVAGGGATEAAFVPFGSETFGPHHDAPTDAPPPVPDARMVADTKMGELAGLEFVPPGGIEPWQAAVVLREEIDDRTVGSWFSGLVAHDIVTITRNGSEVSLAPGPAAASADATTAPIMNKALGRSRSVELGSYSPSFSAAWREAGEAITAWVQSSHVFRHRAPSYGGGGGGGGGLRAAGGNPGLAIAFCVVVPVAVVGTSGAAAAFGLRSAVGAVAVALLIPAVIGWLAYGKLTRSLSARGSAIALRSESFRRFLHDSEAQHVEWAWQNGLLREYSAWAVALGEADAWNHAMSASSVPPVEQTMSGNILVPALYASSFSSTTTAPSSSGAGGGGGFSGGGFSGGGGGGGGGGSW